MKGRNHMNGLKRKEEVQERDGRVEIKKKEVSNGREEFKERNDVANGRETLNEREEVTNRGYEFLTLLMLRSVIL